MITILNRKEFYVTYDRQEQANIRQLLGENGIEYTTKVYGRHSHRDTHRFYGEDNLNEYIIYVKKEDYAKASYLLNDRK